MTVEASTGDVYVADVANQVVDKFNASGAYLSQISGTETPTGTFALAHPAAVAVDNATEVGDPSAGDLYVLDTGNGVVDQFDSSGVYIGQVAGPFFGSLLGIGVDGQGHVWVYGTTEGLGEVQEFDPNGAPVSHFSTHITPGAGFAVDSVGNNYSSNAERGVESFDASGHDLGPLEECIFCQTAIATDVSTGEVYVDDRTEVHEYGANGATLLGAFGQLELGSGGEGGIAVDPTTGVVYVSNAVDKKVYAFDREPGPRVATGEATEVETTSAVVHAAVNPEGADTTYQFEYGTTASYGSTAPIDAEDAGSGELPVPVSTELVGLQGGTTYHFRVVAANADGVAKSADRTFKTRPIPRIDAATVGGLTGSEADLEARINPEGLAAQYHFEWGTTTEYGEVVPIPDASIEASEEDVSVVQHIARLMPNTTYHWRVVASDVNGPVTGSDHTFVYAIPAEPLPDNRAYEMVTPTIKNGAVIGDVTFVGLSPSIAGNGHRVTASTLQCFASAVSCTSVRETAGSPYVFSRTASGWQTSTLAPAAGESGSPSAWNDDATTGMALFSAPAALGAQDDFYGHESDGTVTDLGPVTQPSLGSRTPTLRGFYATRDFTHVVFTTHLSEWPSFDATNLEEAVYEYNKGTGQTQPLMVAVTGGPESTDLIGKCGTVKAQAPNPLSEGGLVYYFTVVACLAGGTGANEGVPVPVSELFARLKNGEAGASTVAISEPQAIQPAPPNLECVSPQCVENTEVSARFRGAEFQGASADGSRVFFTSPQQLTDAASEDPNSEDEALSGGCQQTLGANGCNLYVYDRERPSGHALIAMSAGDSSGGGPRVRGVVGISPDGTHVYFVAGGVLTATPGPEGDLAKSGANNLYLYERDAEHPNGRVSYVAALPSPDHEEWTHPGKPANVTPDGRYLVFVSHGQLTSDDTSVGGALQLFRYDAREAQLVRVSAGENGFNDGGNRSSPTPCIISLCSEDVRLLGSQRLPLGEPARLDPTMSNDGAYVFFMSPVALTPGAYDDLQIGTEEEGAIAVYAQNVYEWHDGHTYLILGGDATADKGQTTLCGEISSACLLGPDESGANVFFSTTRQLATQDTDTELDFYDARICSGSDPCVSAQTSPPPCGGPECHAARGATPPLPVVASVDFSGAGNLSGTPAGRVTVLGHAVTGRTITVVVDVPGRGRLRIAGKGIHEARRTLGGAGAYHVRLRLSAGLRRAARHHKHGIKLRLVVRYVPQTGAASAVNVVILVRNR